MFLTKECNYAIRIVRCLVGSETDSDKITMEMICQREDVPQPFAYKILKKLEHAGIVTVYRGSNGGYLLAKAPHSITLFDVVSAVDKNLFLKDCLKNGFECPLNTDGNYCGVHKALMRVQEMLMNALKDNTIQELI